MSRPAKAIVRRPGHLRIGILPAAFRIVVLVLHDVGRARGMELGEVEPDTLEGPARRTVAARHPAPDVLVKVDEDVEAEVAGASRHSCEVVEIGVIVSTGAGVLDRFPCRQKAQAVEAPVLQPRQMLVGVGEWKGTADERDRAVV
jgi:hypothetical protein